MAKLQSTITANGIVLIYGRQRKKIAQVIATWPISLFRDAFVPNQLVRKEPISNQLLLRDRVRSRFLRIAPRMQCVMSS